MAAVNAAAVHENTVQPVLVADAAVCVLRQVLAVLDVQIQLFWELVPIIDLRKVRVMSWKILGDVMPAALFVDMSSVFEVWLNLHAGCIFRFSREMGPGDDLWITCASF